MNKISAFVVCKNEERVIETALKTLTWADEIIVVDDGSDDKTSEISKKYTSQVFTRAARVSGSVTELRNFALAQCRFPWVFYLDADEFCSPELIDWFREFRGDEASALARTVSSTSSYPPGHKQSPQVGLVEIRRLEYFMGMLTRFGANNPSHQWRFFRKEGVLFEGLVHEYPVFAGRVVRLELPIHHVPKSTPEDLFNKLNKYTSLDAQHLFERGKVRNFTYMFFSGAAMFLKAYFRKQGFRDGGVGLFLAVTEGISFFLRQAKLYFLNKKAGRL